jgi:hypothetical protein
MATYTKLPKPTVEQIKELIKKAPEKHFNLHGNILGETAKAIKFETIAVNQAPLDDPITEWFPLSQVHFVYAGTDLGTDIICVTEWIFNAKGIV